MPKTMVPGAFQTAFPVKWPLKFNMKLPAYAVGSDLTNLGKDLERLGFGPGTYRTYGANAGTLRQPIKTSNYIKEANNSISALLEKLQQIASRAPGPSYYVDIDSVRKLYGSTQTANIKQVEEYKAAQQAAENKKNKIDAELERIGINVYSLDRHYVTLARTKNVLESLQRALPESKPLKDQINAVETAIKAIAILRGISERIRKIKQDAKAGLTNEWIPERGVDEYKNRYIQYTQDIQKLAEAYDTIARGLLYPSYYTLAKSGLYNSSRKSFITDPKDDATFHISPIGKWFTSGHYTDDPQEIEQIKLNAFVKGIIDIDGKFTQNFESALAKASLVRDRLPISMPLPKDIENIQPQPIEPLPTLTEAEAAEKETPVFNLFNIDRDRIKNALTYVIHARRAIEQNAQQSDIQSTDILTNLTNLERSLGTAYAIADYLKRNSGNAGEQLSLEGVQAMRNNLTNSLAKANSALTSLRDSGAFNIIKDRAGIDFIHALRFNPNVNQLLNKFGTKPLKLNEDTANELQQKYTDPTVVDNIITQIVSGKDVTFAAGIPSSTTSTTDQGIKLPEPKPESQKPDTSVVRESLYTVYPEEARKVETLEAVMQDPVLNKHYNFTGRIDALKQLRDQVEQLAGLVQQNPAYEMAYRRALSTYNNMLNSTLAFANVAAKDVYTLNRMRETINSQFGRFEQPGVALPEDVKKQIQQEKEKKITELFTMQKLWEDWKRQEELARKAVMGNPRYKYREEEALQEILDRRRKEFIQNKLLPALPVENRGRFGSDSNFTAQIENIIFNTNPQQFQAYITGHARKSARNLERQYAATLLPQQVQAQQSQAQQVQAQQPLGQPLQPEQPQAQQDQDQAQQNPAYEMAYRRALSTYNNLLNSASSFANVAAKDLHTFNWMRKAINPQLYRNLLNSALSYANVAAKDLHTLNQNAATLRPQQPTGQPPTGQSGQPPTGQSGQPPTGQSGQPSTGQLTLRRQPLTPVQPASAAQTPTATQNLGPPTSNLLAQTNTNQNPKSLPGLNLPKVTKISSYNKLSK